MSEKAHYPAKINSPHLLYRGQKLSCFEKRLIHTYAAIQVEETNVGRGKDGPFHEGINSRISDILSDRIPVSGIQFSNMVAYHIRQIKYMVQNLILGQMVEI